MSQQSVILIGVCKHSDISYSLERVVAVPIQVLRGAFVALLLLGAVSGCSGRGRSNQAEETSSLKPIAKFYGNYVNKHRGQPPKDEAEFKAFLREAANAEQLKADFKITEIDKMFISSRDNKPYIIYYGLIPKSSGPAGAPVVAYEQEGVGGKRFVASAVGSVQEVDETGFRKMVPDAK